MRSIALVYCFSTLFFEAKVLKLVTMLYALLLCASFCIFNGWAELSKSQFPGRKHFSSKIYFGAFVGLFLDSPFPNIMREVELHGMLRSCLGLVVPRNARNYARMDSLVGLALEGWFGELRRGVDG